ncbi:TIGR04222 domain-containing membrane protein [Lentzea guizhouensis]|uniref:TIGR04222 domain-containing membrane protein n=1 Tax=Lentzea guizhouensis TaxID=1586287 RepID=UPI000AE82FE0|nr:TIGR04222 domain-containing membrane protein [Lentzea guizhouensis]
MEPWGLSGPEFLQLYWIGLALAVLAAIVIRVRARAGGSQPVRTLDVDEIAYLAGGPRRVVETAVARLLTAGELRISRRGAVSATNSPQSRNHVDRAVLTDSQRYSNRTVSLMIPAVAKDIAVRAIGLRLQELGLVLSEEAVKRARRNGSALLWLLLAVGVVRWVNGIAIDANIGWLSVQLVITAVLIFFVLRRGKNLRTTTGDRVLDAARTAGGRATGSEDPALVGAAGLVALGGLTVYPDLAVRSSLLAAPAGTSSGYTGGSACSTSSSSCSSGSSCGGGGGCGGGGS